MSFPNSFFYSSLTSESPTSKDIEAVPVGAGSTQDSYDHFYYHDKFIKWIQETKQKLPRGTPKLRKEAFLADPLIKGLLYPYLKNTLLPSFNIVTKDNKLYEEAVCEIEDFIEQIELMTAFRDDFLNLHFLVGHSYRRLDLDANQKTTHLEYIEPNSFTVLTDPWNSTIIFYRQRANVRMDLSDNGTYEPWDSWFIPYSGAIENLNDVYVDGRLFGNSDAVLNRFNDYQKNYNLTTLQQKRIAASERILAMHHSIDIQINDYDDDDYYYNERSFAPIDSVLLAIFLKRLLLVNSPNLIFTVLSPFLHARFGTVAASKDAQGNSVFIKSNPDRPSSQIPEIYAREQARYNDFISAFKTMSENIMKNFKEGGVITTGPDIDIKPIESSRNITHQFIKGLIDQLDEEISQNFGVPMALFKASGSELATSRTIAQIYNSVHAGDRGNYESEANKLIKRQFAGRTWAGTTVNKDELTGEKTEVEITYSFEEIKAHFELEISDSKDQLQEAQTINSKADTLVKLKAAGAGIEDLQAIGDELGFGMLALDGVQTPTSTQTDPQATDTTTTDQMMQEPTAAQMKAMLPMLKAMMAQVLSEEGIISLSPKEPNIDDIVESTSKYIEKGYDDLIDEFSKMLHKKVSN